MSIRDMVARHSDYDETKDFVPTPPFATRALFEHVAPSLKRRADSSMIWDPACGQGHMLQVFQEYGSFPAFGSDTERTHLETAKYRLGPLGASRARFYECSFVGDPGLLPLGADAIITNPPYKLALPFMERAVNLCKFGAGMLMRVQSLETQGRYPFFSSTPPTQLAFFSDRIPFKSGKVVRKAPKMFFHVWLWWEKDKHGSLLPPRPPMWIPPSVQLDLEKDEDYAI